MGTMNYDVMYNGDNLLKLPQDELEPIKSFDTILEAFAFKHELEKKLTEVCPDWEEDPNAPKIVIEETNNVHMVNEYSPCGCGGRVEIFKRMIDKNPPLDYVHRTSPPISFCRINKGHSLNIFCRCTKCGAKFVDSYQLQYSGRTMVRNLQLGGTV